VTDTPLLVLVHGAWHGAWCWAGLQAELDGRGLPSLALDLPGHGASTLPFGDLEADAAHVAAVIRRVAASSGGHVVLVGHSYAGAVIGEATRWTEAVEHLVYIAGFCLDAGETVSHQTDVEYPAIALSGALFREGDLLTVDPAKARECFYAECPPAAADAAIARLCPQPVATFTQPAQAVPWRTIPSTYIVCSRDQAVHPLHQQAMAERCGHVVTLETDHSPFASDPDAVADVLEGIVRR
jgi:pimeloyl-ACP methyl ester carboxylesterase